MSVQLRQVDGSKETGNTTEYESPDSAGQQAVCAFYLADSIVAEIDSEYLELTVAPVGEGALDASFDNVTGSNDDGNYAVYSTTGGAISGAYLSHELLSDEVTSLDPDPENAPESVAVSIEPSDESSFEEADEVDQDEAEALLA